MQLGFFQTMTLFLTVYLNSVVSCYLLADIQCTYAITNVLNSLG